MTDSQKLEAIKARINGVWDNPQLMKIGELLTNTQDDILRILSFKVDKDFFIKDYITKGMKSKWH